MNINKFTLILFSFVLAIIFLTTPVFALQYNYFLDNGKWSQFTDGLSSSFYETDQYFNTYDRGFENISTSSFINTCSGEWCSTGVASYGSPTYSIQGTTEDYFEGSQSLKLYVDGESPDQARLQVWGKNEILTDANIIFNYKYVETGTTANNFVFGYVDDDNFFVEVDRLQNIPSTDGWQEFSITLSAGSPKRFGIYVSVGGSGSTGTATLYVDNVRVIKNNTGTFRTSDPQYCGSLGVCSNTTNFLKSNELGGTYWVVDYVEDASCSWSKNGISQGAMIEGTSGMYYVDINHSVTSGSYDDVNLSATCDRIPFVTKSFFVSPRLFRYGLIDGGNFEEETTSNFINSCTDYFCAKYVHEQESGFTSVVDISSEQYFDGRHSLKSSLSGSGYRVASNYIWSKEEYSGGDTIYINYMVYKHTPEYSSGSRIYFGYVNDSNVFTSVGDFLTSSVTEEEWYSYDITIPAGNLRFAIRQYANNSDEVAYFDVVTSSGKKQVSTLTTSNTLTNNFGVKGTLYTFSSDYKNQGGFPILDATCEVTIQGTDYPMVYNPSTQKYEYETAFVTDGTYTIETECESDSYDTKDDTYSIEITTPASQIVLFDAIQNISSYSISDFEPRILFTPSTKFDDIIFSVTNTGANYDVLFDWFNLDLSSGKNYFVYVSDDGVTWTFDETLTFGSSSDDPLQKIRGVDRYNYSYETTLLNGEKIYFKLVYQDVGKWWNTIRTSNDWVHYNTPTTSVLNGHSWDAYSVSQLTELRSQLKLPFSQLLSGDFVRGVHVQFTAYATADVDVDVQMFGGTSGSGTGTVSITTTPTRFDVLLNPMYSEEDVLRLLSDGSANSIIYMTDYHIVPSSYFVDGMTLKNKDRSVLNAIMVEGVGSKQYIREGEPFRITTSAYDRDGDLDRLEVRTFADIGTGVLIGVSSYSIKDATKSGQYFDWDILVDGIVDLNGNYVNPSQLRDIYVHARLFNNDDYQVAQISRTVSLLQYPYFPNDLKLTMNALTNKYGENPKFYVQFENAVPDAFVGLRFVFHESGSFSSPAYEKTIYADELNCNSLIICRKNLNFSEYVYNPTDALDYVSVEFLVNTEYPLSDDKASSFLDLQPLTLKSMPLILNFRQLETARVFQVFEREYNVYRHDEKVALVLQTRDIPFRDLTSVLNVELMFNVCDAETGGTCVLHDVNYSPNSTRYDATTGYSYHYFNTFVIDTAGDLLQDGNYLEPIVQINDLTGAMSGSVALVTHANKCQSASWGTAFNWLGFNMNVLHDIWDATKRGLYGCGDLTDPIVALGSAQGQRLDINTSHARIGGQNHSIICVNTSGKDYVSNLNQEMFCMVLFKQSDEQIDSFRFYISNDSSDFSRTSELEKQFIEIEIPAEKIIFEDMHIMAKTLEAEFQVDSIDTIGEVAFYGFDKLFSGIANPFTDVVTWTYAPTGVFTNVGWDWNWDRTFDPNFLNGIFWIKVEGLRVTNQQDYVSQYPELHGLQSSYFRRWVNQKDVFIPKQKDAKIWILGSDFNPVMYFEPTNNLVINAISNDFVQTQDANTPVAYRTSRQRFNFISDLLSDNFSKNERLYIPIWFSYLVPPKPFNVFEFVGDVLFGETQAGHPSGAGHPIGLISNPTGFAIHNWFWILILVVTLLVTSLIYKNFKGGGNVNIYSKESWGSE